MQIGKLIGRRAMLATLISFALALAAAPVVTAAVPKFQVGSRPTFRIHSPAAVAADSSVFLTIASKRKVNKNGELKRTAIGNFAQMNKKRNGNFAWTPPPYTFPDWFMMRPGTYFWQTYYIDCAAPDCHVLSTIKSFKVVE